MKKNKKAIELAVNFLVVLIIALIVFGMGVWLAFKFFGKTSAMAKQVDSQTENELISILSTERVGIVKNEATIRVGKYHTFWLGLKNSEETAKFCLSPELSKYIDKSDVEQPISSEIRNGLEIVPPAIPVSGMKSYILKNSGRVLAPIAVSAARNAISGKYIITVQVFKVSKDAPCSREELYGTKQKIYVEVP